MSEGKIVIGRMADEDCYTIDCTASRWMARWIKLTTEAGGEIITKSDVWTRFKIPADKLRIGLRHTRTMTEEQREVLRQRMQKVHAAQRQEG